MRTKAGSRLREEAGDTLIEVVISAFLVGIMVVGTLTGFGALDHASAQDRQHSEAIALADQSLEQMRSDPASVLEKLKNEPHAYTQAVGGTTYTITQSAELLPESGSGATCSVTEKSRQSGNAFAISATVTWHAQEAGNRKPVIASGVITPPVGSALEIDANNAPNPTGGVEGVRAVVKYTPASGGGAVTLEETTAKEGCVVFGDIPATEATVEIPELTGFVTRSGASKYPSLEVATQEVELAPNYTTHHEILYNRAGQFEAKFSYKGATGVYKHLDNEGKEPDVEENITGDTFVAFNSDMATAPDFELGSTSITSKAAPYNPAPSTYRPEGAVTPKILFPFPESETKPWNIYAGDCPENNPEKVNGEKPLQQYVNPGETKSITIPMSRVELNVYKATEKTVNEHSTTKWSYLETSTSPSYPVTITNHACASSKPPNNEAAIAIEHKQPDITTGASNGGHLEDPFQPFGKEFTLCLADPTTKLTYIVTYENLATEGGVIKGKTAGISIYLPQKPLSEVEETRIADETTYKAKEGEYNSKKSEYETKKKAYEEKKKAYEEKEGYKTKHAEAETKKKEWETEETKYKTEKTKYETEKTKYTNEKSKYETEKTKYTNEKSKYETKKAEYKTNKEKYESTHKAEYKTKYEADQTEYEKAEKEYKAAETAYKAAEAEYLKAETEYKAAQKAYEAAEKYKTYKSEYETDEKEWGEYNTPKEEAASDEAAYKSAEKYVIEYNEAKTGAETAKGEETEAKNDSVTVKKETTCP